MPAALRLAPWHFSPPAAAGAAAAALLHWLAFETTSFFEHFRPSAPNVLRRILFFPQGGQPRRQAQGPLCKLQRQSLLCRTGYYLPPAGTALSFSTSSVLFCSLNLSPPSPDCRFLLFEPSAKPSAAAKSGLAHICLMIFDFAVRDFVTFAKFVSASKLAATWRAYAGRRSLCLNLEQRRRKHLEGFIAMPSPATLSSCVLSLNATHSCCVPLYVPRKNNLPTLF
jgi:hypothetical protein